MNKYNIKVGDYVETWDGAIGYVTKVADSSFAFEVTSDGKKIKHSHDRYFWYPLCLIDDENVIKRVGVNDFSKRKIEFKSIEKLDCFCDFEEIVCKVNKLIDHINAIQESQERLDEYDSTRID